MTSKSMKRNLLSLSVAAAIAASAMIVSAGAQASYEYEHEHKHKHKGKGNKGKYLISWMGDQMLDGNNHSPLDDVLGLPSGTLPDADFIAVIDANPRSPTYGKVVNTAEMPAVYGEHLLSSTDDFVDEALDLALCLSSTSPTLSDATGVPPAAECTPQVGATPSIGLSGTGLDGPFQGDILGGVPNFNHPHFGGPGNGLPAVVPAPSSVLNEPHHHSVYPYVSPIDGSVNAYYGGLISSNVFGCNITDPLNITPAAGSVEDNIFGPGPNKCGLSISGRSDTDGTFTAMEFSGLDDLEYNPVDGKYYTTMMGAGGSFTGAYSPVSTSASSLPPVLTTPGGVIVYNPADGTVVQASAVPDLTKFGASSPSVYGHGYFADGTPMLGPKRYAPRVQLGFGGVDGNGECAAGDLMTGAGVTAFNLCVPGVAPHNQIGPDTGAVDLDAGINEGPDTGLLAHPHGIGLRTDLVGQIADADGNPLGTTLGGIMMTSDYADPVSLALTGSGEGAASSKQNLGTTIRLWDMARIENGPYQVIQMPDGNRHEDNAIHEEPEGLMAMRMMHHGKGAFVASMCGGIIYYAPDITVAKPEFRIVYDFGACTGASVFTITQDDKFMFVPISGIQKAGDPIHNRDYDGEHDGRIAVLDLRRLTRAGTSYQCDMSPASAWDNSGADSPLGQPLTLGVSGEIYTNRGDHFNGTTYHPNNGSRDCPDLVDQVNLAGVGEDGIIGTADDHPDAETTRGGPHFTTHDRNDRYVATSNYFVDLREFAIRDVDLLLTALGLGHGWDNGSGGAIDNAYPPGGPGPGEFPAGGLGGVHAVLDDLNEGVLAGGALAGKLPGFKGREGNILPGTGSVGDDTVCMMKWNRKRRNLKLDHRFNAGDPDSPTGCLDMDFGDAGKQWPSAGARHPDAGNATPHGMSFIKVGSNRFFTNGEL